MCCNKNYQHNFEEKLTEILFNTYTFSNRVNNKFILLSRKGVYLYECMNDWDKFNETSLPEKEHVYSHLIMEDFTNSDYARAKKNCKYFEIKNFGEYHDFYIQTNTLLLEDVYENLQKLIIST